MQLLITVNDLLQKLMCIQIELGYLGSIKIKYRYITNKKHVLMSPYITNYQFHKKNLKINIFKLYFNHKLYFKTLKTIIFIKNANIYEHCTLNFNYTFVLFTKVNVPNYGIIAG